MSQLESRATAPRPSKSREEVSRVLLIHNGEPEIREDVLRAGLKIVEPGEDPHLVITYGGDGTLLGADRDFPDLPKLPIRRDHQFDKCPLHTNAELLRRIKRGEHEVSMLKRLKTKVNGRRIQAMNDIVFHNENAQSAVRYRVHINGQPYSEEIVGDGLVVATPFGSSAYYRSITESVFRVGVGLAFNNSTEAVNHLVLDPHAIIEVEVIRGPGIVFGDNDRQFLRVENGDRFKIGKASSRAEIWELSALICRNCREAKTGRPAGTRHV